VIDDTDAARRELLQGLQQRARPVTTTATTTTTANNEDLSQRQTRRPTTTDNNQPLFKKDYHGYVVQFMSWLFEDDFPSSRLFTPSEFKNVTPLNVVHWMKYKTYGNQYPGPNDRPLYWRSNTLYQAKKALSHYMPQSHAPWNPLTNPPSGNPTKSKEVNDLIKEVKKAEVRKIGKESQATRALKTPEFRLSQVILQRHEDFDHRYRYTSMMRHQFHLICRADDVSNFETADVRAHPRFDYCLEQRVQWSKNVMEERDCPPQILIGANDIQYCVLLALAVYLESWFRTGAGAHSKYLYTDARDGDAPSRLNKKYRANVNEVFAHTEMTQLSQRFGGKIGTHSNRKYPTTYCREKGCILDEAEVRGRWRKGRGRVVDRYAELSQPYVDAKVACALCVGGPIKYVLKPDSGITEEWLLQNVTRAIHQFYGATNPVAKVLALPLLWACLLSPSNDDQTFHLVPVPDRVRESIVAAYEEIRQLPQGINPVAKVCLEFR
jgi:hypothetical protein